MLRVTLDATVLKAARLDIVTVSALQIRNDGTGTPAVGNYVWELRDGNGTVRVQGRLDGYVREQGAETLVWAILCQLQKAAPTGIGEP